MPFSTEIPESRTLRNERTALYNTSEGDNYNESVERRNPIVSRAPEVFERPIAVNGVTGGIGSALAERLAQEGASLILMVRDVHKGEAFASTLGERYGTHSVVIQFDYDHPDTLKESLSVLKTSETRLFFNVAGIYHQAPDLSSGLERTYLINYVEPVRFISSLLEQSPKTRIVAVSSLTAILRKTKGLRKSIDWKRPAESMNGAGGRTSSYALSKSLLISALVALQGQGADIRFAHPGVSCTNLFNPKNKAYPSWFYKVAPPIMRKIFMSPAKACLSVYEAGISEFDYKASWLGPRGLFHAWGKPGETKLPKWLRENSEEALSFALSWEGE